MQQPLRDRRILFIARALNRGGAERQLVVLARGLAERGWAVRVVTLYTGGALERELAGTKVDLVSIHKRGRWSMVGPMVRMARSVRAYAPAIIHGYLALPNVIAVPLRYVTRPRARVVFGVRGTSIDWSKYDWTMRLLYFVEKSLSGAADLVVSNSHTASVQLRAGGFGCTRLLVIPNGIDTDRFSPNAAARSEVRRGLGIAPDEVVVGVPARFDPMKDHATFLRAAAILDKGATKYRFVFIGEGPSSYIEHVRATVAESGLLRSVLFLEPTDRIEDTYNAFDIGVSCSAFGEGFSNSLAEMMSVGLPCVATDCGDSKAIVGDCGVVVAAGEPEALARGIELAASSRTDPFSVRARIVENFSRERLIDRSEAAFMQLLTQVA